MASVTTGIGPYSGIDIAGTVDKLIAIAAKPKDLLTERNSKLTDQKTAIVGLNSLLYSLEYVTDNLGKTDLYQKNSVTSSLSDVVSATASGAPALSSYQITALRQAQAQQWMGSGVASDSQALGGGTISFRFGDNLARNVALEQVGEGAGITRGSIRIVDRSGAKADIDLSKAQSLDDVLEAINSNSELNVTATAVGDHIRLTDNTGQSVSNLKVLELGSTTAASLGLAGIDVAAATADGAKILALHRGMTLAQLNDGAGVRVSTKTADIEYHLRDGTTGQIDLSPIVSGSSDVDADITLGAVIDRINAAAPGKLQVKIAADGKRLEIDDLTSGDGEFSLSALYDSHALADLGLDGAPSGGTLTGRRVLGDLQSVLLSSLNGGRGLGQLGTLQLTDRSGATATVDLSAAETVDDVLAAINAAGIGVAARLNSARTGIEIADTTGATSGNLIVASGDANETAERLKIAVNGAVGKVDSGDLHLQVVSDQTKLADLNGGSGVARGSFSIVDSRGAKTTINLASSSGITTVGDLIAAINRQAVGVVAEINDTGDGIRIRDLNNAGGTLKITEGSSSTAHDLHLLGDAQQVEIDGVNTWVVDGSTTQTITLSSSDTLKDLVTKINDLDASVSASIFNDGSSLPAHLTLTSQQTGRRGALVIDTSGLSFSLSETARGEDALLRFGSGNAARLVASPTDTFASVVDGLKIELKGTSDTPAVVKVDRSDTDLVATVKTMVDDYNKMRDSLTSLTKYDTTTDTAAVLTGDAAALRLDNDLSRLLTSRFSGVGSFRSLAELGITVTDEGKLELDDSKLSEQFAADPQSVQSFFSTEKTGFSAQMHTLLEQIGGESNSLLAQRASAIDKKMADNAAKIDDLTKLLDSERNRMLTDFYNMEIAIGKIQNNQTVLDAINATWLNKSTSSSSSSSK